MGFYLIIFAVLVVAFLYDHGTFDRHHGKHIRRDEAVDDAVAAMPAPVEAVAA